MKRTVLSSALLACALMASAQTDAIKIDLTQRGAFVSPNLYGIFFEEISHAGDGGLYAELVQNRGFEEHVLPSSMTYENGRAVAVDSPNYEHGNHRHWSVPWNLEQKKMQGWKAEGWQCNLLYDIVAPQNPLHPNTPHALQLRISDLQTGGRAVLTNTGYWGMGLKTGEKYDLRLYVQSTDYKGTLTARLTDAENGRDLGSVSFKAKKWKQWTELTAVLTAAGTTAKGALALEFDAAGTVLVDYVSLFPQNTFKGRKNGQRPDIAQMLVDLHPRFMRWPGGCIVEGATYENRVKWKETLGDPMTRRGEWDTWGYRATWGMGYHEFLQFCEDLGMDAMFVNNAGMSCSVRNGDFIADTTQLEPVVQDFRDAIDYALGDPATNQWAKMRADAGHPAPFPLRYVEIGNENVGPEYVKHFNYIFRRLKAEYPRITFINTLGHIDRLLAQMPGRYMVDPHWYRDPNFFFNNNHLFDEAPRDHDIYVGEYACNAGVGQGNLLAALSEAAFILGMERNSDVVKMSSYAPLFENVNQPNWTCNLIHFNSTQVFGRASYYVQQMAALNRPTYNVGVSETTTSAEAAPFAAGTFGLGTYATQSTYRNIVLTTADGQQQRQLSPSDFKLLRGTWNTEDGQLTQTSDEQHTMALLPDFQSDTYTLSLQARKIDGREGFFIYYGMDPEGRNGYTANIAGWGNSQTVMQLMRRGRSTDILSRRRPHSVDAGRWYDLRLEVTPMLVTLYIDGEKVTETRPTAPTRQFCQAGYDERNGEVVIKVVNATEHPYTRTFNLIGAKDIEPQATAITLAGKADEENTFDQPKRIAPVESYFMASDSCFSYDFAPMSFTILRIKAKSPLQRRRGFGFDAKHPDVHDPVMAKGEDGRYYLFMTGFGVGVISSADLKEWKQEPSVLNPAPQWAREAVRGYGGHTWAPDISYHNGQWYLYYSCSTFGKNGSAIGLATNKTLDPTSPQFGWKDQGMVIRSQRGKDDFNAIDPNLVVDEKGQPWLTFGSFWDGIQLVKLSKKDFKTPKGRPVTISRRVGRKLTHDELNDVASWTVENGRDTIEAGPNAVEAPFILRHGDYYYLFVSFDFCCRGERSTYKTVYGRAKNVEGPYLDRKGQDMAHGGGTLLYGPNEKYFGVGHNAAYDMDGRTWFLSHAYEKEQNGRAKLFLRPITFDSEGWIVTE